MLRALRTSRRGVAVTEFALIAPLLIIMLGIALEAGRMLITYRQFQAAATGVARHIVRYPEYEKRARDYSPAVLKALLPAGSTGNVDLSVASLTKTGGTLREAFPVHVLLGRNPGIDWRTNVRDADYANEESVVFVGAVYHYKSMFVPGVFDMDFRKTVTLIPPFSRGYPWNDNQVADKYVY